MKIQPILLILFTTFALCSQVCSAGSVRIKDITRVEGDRENPLVGLGLVAGLNGTGGKSPITRQFASNLENRLAVRNDPAVRALLDFDQTRKTTSLSVVMVTANLPSYAREGSKIDVTVAVWDDAKSLQGGILISTPLYGPDGEVYAVAEGPVSIGGFSFSGDAASVASNYPNSGRVSNGANVEKETCTNIAENGQLNLLLSDPDYETARRISDAINVLAADTCRVIDPATVLVRVPDICWDNPAEWVSRIGSLTVNPDTPARVVINERTGTVIIGENVRLSRVLITHSNLTVITTESPQVSQPAPVGFGVGKGETVVVPRTEVNVTEGGIAVTEVVPNVTVGELAFALNALGVAPRDLSSIFQQLKESGALHAELELK